MFGVDNDPAGKDVVVCGGGFDWVFADRNDAVAPNCEKVADRYSEFDQVFSSIPQSFWDGLPPPFGPQYPSKPQDYAKAAGLAKAFDQANINPLVGDWRRNRTCDELVRRLKQAGLADQIPEWVAGSEFGGGVNPFFRTVPIVNFRPSGHVAPRILPVADTRGSSAASSGCRPPL